MPRYMTGRLKRKMSEIICEVTFCELRSKQVVNVADGKALGNIIDVVFDLKTGRILGLVAPGCRRFVLFKPREDVFIPWRCVRKIGDDVIIVDMPPARGGYDYDSPRFRGGAVREERAFGRGEERGFERGEEKGFERGEEREVSEEE